MGTNAKEAAEKSGFEPAKTKGPKLLKRKEIKKFIAELERQQKPNRNNVAKGYNKLAFGCSNDAIELLFTDEIDKKAFRQLDLFNVSEIKRKNDGGIEIKFFNRIEALEKLNELCGKTDENSPASGLYSAIAASAEAIRHTESEEKNICEE